MARPIKDGVDYFPKDTTFYSDDKVRLLRAEFGAKGMYLLDYILCEIYGKNGYFMQWDPCRCYLVSDGAGCGCDPQFVGEFVAGCVRCSFFDKRVFDLFGVLTSPGIQRRYVRMFNGRDEIAMKEDYFLLDTSSKKDVPIGSLNKLRLIPDKSTENPDKSTGNPDKSTGNEQKKGKEKKTKESKTKYAPAVPAEIAKEWAEYKAMRVRIRKPMTAYAEKLMLQKLAKLAPDDTQRQKAILNQSIANGWQGLFELKDSFRTQAAPARDDEEDDFCKLLMEEHDGR